VLSKPDVSQREGDHFFPFVLPGGRAVLFTITAPGQVENAQVALLDVKTGNHKTLIRGGSNAEYVETGHLVYAAAGSLRAVRFDLARLEVQSDPFPVVERVTVSNTGAANYAIARHGTLVFVPGGAGIQTPPRSLVWVNRQGREEPIKAPPRAYTVPRLSPDGTRVALEIRDLENDIWIWDLARQTLTRLTFDPALDQAPVWTPDGRRVIFASPRGGPPNLFAHAADGTGADERLTTSTVAQLPNSAAPDGTGVAGFEVGSAGPDVAFFTLPAPAKTLPAPTTPASSAPNQTRVLVKTTFVEINAEISPDGRFIAYQSTESGQNQIYVRPFPNVDAGRWQPSTGGGSRPAWNRNGRELFYLDGSGALTSVPVQLSGPSFSVGNPARVIETHYAAPGGARPYDVAPDGQRFLMIKDLSTADDKVTSPSLVVVERWFEELKARLPAR
jgi:serine/threonine-protein kinase